MSSQDPDYEPLLPSDRRAKWNQGSGMNDWIGKHIVYRYGEGSWPYRLRHTLQWFFGSKWGHYAVLTLVSLDVGCIFADFLIDLHTCEHPKSSKQWLDVQDVLGVVSLVFSCLFMLELILSVWAFGFSYFKSKFHCFDATVIVAGFIVDVCLRGVLEEVGSLVVIGRLWRIFKIIEEFSGAAEDQLGALEEQIEGLEEEKSGLRSEVHGLRLENEGLKKEVGDLKHRLVTVHGDTPETSE